MYTVHISSSEKSNTSLLTHQAAAKYVVIIFFDGVRTSSVQKLATTDTMHENNDHLYWLGPDGIMLNPTSLSNSILEIQITMIHILPHTS